MWRSGLRNSLSRARWAWDRADGSHNGRAGGKERWEVGQPARTSLERATPNMSVKQMRKYLTPRALPHLRSPPGSGASNAAAARVTEDKKDGRERQPHAIISRLGTLLAHTIVTPLGAEHS